MSRPDEPDITDMDAVLVNAWALLGRGVADRRHGFHHPAIANSGLSGEPRNRIVILRAADSTQRTIRFHTDRRSAKYDELANDPRVSALFYDAGDRVQLRCEGKAFLHDHDAVADAAWLSSQRMSRVCYGTMPAPGAVMMTGGDFALPQTEAELLAGRANFVAVVIVVDIIEWLFLRHGGHRRARFDLVTGARNWLAP
jgi:pyridoxamine 5'-phosphate oxidase